MMRTSKSGHSARSNSADLDDAGRWGKRVPSFGCRIGLCGAPPTGLVLVQSWCFAERHRGQQKRQSVRSAGQTGGATQEDAAAVEQPLGSPGGGHVYPSRPADVMEDGAQDSAAIAAARGLVPDRVYRLLRALSTVGIVAEPSSGASRSPRSGVCSARIRPHNTRTTAIFLNDYFADMWMHLDERSPASTPPSKRSRAGRSSTGLTENPEEARRFNRMI